MTGTGQKDRTQYSESCMEDEREEGRPHTLEERVVLVKTVGKTFAAAAEYQRVALLLVRRSLAQP